MTSRLGTGRPLTFFYSVIFLNACCFSNVYLEHEDVRPRPALTHGSPNICIYSENIKTINYWNKAHLQQTYMGSFNGANVFCILSSLPRLPQPPRQYLDLSSLYCIVGAGLANHMMREVLWDQKRRRPWDTVEKKSRRSVAHNIS